MFEGGALYTSWSRVNLINSSLTNNSAEKNAGAIYFDKGKLTINGTNLTGNMIDVQSDTRTNCIYAHDVDATFIDSIFNNGGVSVYADFATDSRLINITRNDDIFLLNNKDYIVSVETPYIKLNLTKNAIDVDNIPSKFDSREWGWVTPEKFQKENDDCWAFATVAALETALLKSTGTAFNLSQNYVQTLQLKYVINGDLRNSLTGFTYSGLGYALGWYGVLPIDSDYDDRGMIKDTDLGDLRVHVQDARIIFTNQKDIITKLKIAIMEYGAVAVQMIGNKTPTINTTGEDIAEMDHDTHFVTLIGWNDENETWICKDSLTGFGEYPYDSAFYNADYYAIVPQQAAIAYIFENNIDYHVNYQTDLTGLTGFDGNYTFYSNEFISKYSELIGAVGTYFNDSDIQYSFDVYVNGVKVHTQSGVSAFAGFRTIVLNKYIPINEGDKFKVMFKSNVLPYQAYSRTHYLPEMSFVSSDGENWQDLTLSNKTVCLKVYTISDDLVSAPDLVKYYSDPEQFVVTVNDAQINPVVNKSVNITINSVTYKRTTNENGTASLNINLNSGEYPVIVAVDDIVVNSTVTVKSTIDATDIVKVFRNATQYYSKFSDAKGNIFANTTVSFNVNGIIYNHTTNENGTAKLNINLDAGNYILTAMNPVTGEMKANTIKVISLIELMI